jgi:branched-chain amino acid transport system permease protein
VLSLELALAGLGLGSIAALSGIGLLITYRATGVFNLAHGALAVVVAYVYWQLAVPWGWPRPLAAAVAILVVGPLVGVATYLGVFRSLQRRAAPAGESLVATLGLFVLLVGVTTAVWGLNARRVPPVLLTGRVRLPAGVAVRSETLADLGVVVGTSLVLWFVTRRTRLGLDVRAVVDSRELAELARVDADRVAMLGWAAGATFAGMTGVLLAPSLSLTPYGLTLVVLETFAVPVVARLSSLPFAVLAALVIGVGQSELAQVHVDGRAAVTAVQALQSNLFVVVLLVALLVLPRLKELGGDAGSASAFASRVVTTVSRRRQAVRGIVAALLLASPLVYPAAVLRDAQQVPALALVFVSLVLVTGYSGQISLGHGGFAGLGALVFARESGTLTQSGALLLAALAAGVLGFLTGYPAIRRRGLFLALTTFAVGAVVSRFVLQQPTFTTGLHVSRPDLAGLQISGDRAFYAYELTVLAAGLLLVRNLRSGRLGRALVAMRDSEAGSRSVGLDLRTLKVFSFTVSAALAGVGGALLCQASLSFDATTYEPVQSSLFWFTCVVVFGADSAAGAVAAAGLVVMIGALTATADAALVPVGVLALLLGRLPGGVVELVRRGGFLRFGGFPPGPGRVESHLRTVPGPAARLSPLGVAVRERLRDRAQA